MSDKEKTLDARNEADARVKVPDLRVSGDPDRWELLVKASSKSQGWERSTKVMFLAQGAVVAVSTQHGSDVAEALVFIPEARRKDFFDE